MQKTIYLVQHHLQITEYKKSYNEIDKENSSLKYQLEQKDEEIDKLKVELSTKDKIINKLQAEKENIKAQLQKFKKSKTNGINLEDMFMKNFNIYIV